MTAPSSRPPNAWRAWRPLWLGLTPFIACNASFLAAALGGGYGPFFKLVGPVYLFNTLGAPVFLTLGALMALRRWRASTNRSRALLVACLGMLALAVALVGTYYYATHWEPNRLVVREVAVRTTKVSRPIRIVHVSDIQTGAVGEHERRCVERIIAAKPDLLLFTGDLIQPVAPATYESELDKIMPLLEKIEAPLGKFAVIGDVDAIPTWAALDGGEGGLTLLVGESAVIEAEGAKIRLFGMELMQSAGREVMLPLAHWLQTVEPEDFSIVMGHRPDFILQTSELPIDLSLAGHTHGGQVRIPFVGPIVTLSHVPRDWARGFRQVGKTRLNVSAGLGCERHTTLPKLRFFCPPEFTIIDLLPATEAN
jgi:predicted MPP superfamily phosphohydrolase